VRPELQHRWSYDQPRLRISALWVMTRPITVMHLISTSGPGGAETACVNLIRGLDPERWRGIAVVPEKGWLYDEVRRAGGQPLVLDSHSRFDLPRYFVALARLVRHHKVGLIHGHLFGPSYIASFLGLLLRLPVVGTLHGQVDLHPEERFKRIKFGLLNRGASRLVFVSESLRRFFLGTGRLRSEITAVIPNGVDAARFSRAPDRSSRAAFGASDDEFLVGAVGNVRPAKGYDVLLRAAALLKARSVSYRFVVVGEADSDLGLRLLSLREELGLTDCVSFTGYLRDVPNALNAFDVYAITSRSEGFSISTVEAMAVGLPVVATRCGGPEEIVDDGITGILVDNGSPEAVAAAIESLRVNGRWRRELGEAARTAVRRRFTLDAHLHAYEALYEKCLIEHRGRRSVTADKDNVQVATGSPS
jgi:glycosyltransferase involved in cell wall biosynthesis